MMVLYSICTASERKMKLFLNYIFVIVCKYFRVNSLSSTDTKNPKMHKLGLIYWRHCCLSDKDKGKAGMFLPPSPSLLPARLHPPQAPPARCRPHLLPPAGLQGGGG